MSTNMTPAVENKKDFQGGNRGDNRGGNRGGRGGRFNKEEKSEFDSVVLELARVTRVTEGGKHMNFRALVVIGDRHGRVGFGVDKGKDVQLGVDKATRQAKKNMIKVPVVHETIPHTVLAKYKAAKVLLTPAPRGSGIIAGGSVRVVLDLAGVPNVSSKILGHTKNKVTIVKATFEALKKLFPIDTKRVGVIRAKKVVKSEPAVVKTATVVTVAPASVVKKATPAKAATRKPAAKTTVSKSKK